MAERQANDVDRPVAAETGAPAEPKPDGVELSDEQLDKVSGGATGEFTSVSNVLKTRHDTAKNMISNIR